MPKMFLCHLLWAAFSLFVSAAVGGRTSALCRRVDRIIPSYNLMFTFRLIHLFFLIFLIFRNTVSHFFIQHTCWVWILLPLSVILASKRSGALLWPPRPYSGPWSPKTTKSESYAVNCTCITHKRMKRYPTFYSAIRRELALDWLTDDVVLSRNVS